MTSRSPLSSSPRLATVLAIIAIAITSTTAPTRGQDAPTEGRISAGLPQISVIDKLLAVEVALARALNRNSEEAWVADYTNIYQNVHRDLPEAIVSSTERPRLALALGIFASDGVIALKARSIEDLNSCAESIEKLARRLDVEDQYLGKVNMVKQHAYKRQWAQAFLGLGFLQHEVMRALKEHPDRRPDAVVVVVGGWLQGGRAVTDFILQHPGATDGEVPISNILREPDLLRMMIQEVDQLPEATKSHPVMAEVIKFLPIAMEKVTVGRADAVPEEDVRYLRDEFDRLVQLVLAAE